MLSRGLSCGLGEALPLALLTHTRVLASHLVAQDVKSKMNKLLIALALAPAAALVAPSVPRA